MRMLSTQQHDFPNNLVTAISILELEDNMQDLEERLIRLLDDDLLEDDEENHEQLEIRIHNLINDESISLEDKNFLQRLICDMDNE